MFILSDISNRKIAYSRFALKVECLLLQTVHLCLLSYKSVSLLDKVLKSYSVFKWHGLQIYSTNCVYIGKRVILKLENTKHTFLFMSSIKFCSESAFLCWQFTEKLQQTGFSVVVLAWSFISLYKSHIDSRKLHFYYLLAKFEPAEANSN